MKSWSLEHVTDADTSLICCVEKSVSSFLWINSRWSYPFHVIGRDSFASLYIRQVLHVISIKAVQRPQINSLLISNYESFVVRRQFHRVDSIILVGSGLELEQKFITERTFALLSNHSFCKTWYDKSSSSLKHLQWWLILEFPSVFNPPELDTLCISREQLRSINLLMVKPLNLSELLWYFNRCQVIKRFLMRLKFSEILIIFLTLVIDDPFENDASSTEVAHTEIHSLTTELDSWKNIVLAYIL